jgi:cytochrome bd-type quinol oxidase subunit 2
MRHEEATTCRCHVAPQVPAAPAGETIHKTARSAPALLLSVLIAFFPKCAVCWAAYMSMLGTVWLARALSWSWLFPVLLAFSGLHLALLLRKSGKKGYGPFLLSLAGIAALLAGRSLFPQDRWILAIGMLLMVAGSLRSSFSADHLQMAASGAGQNASRS